MLRLAILALGFSTIVMIAPSTGSTTLQNHQIQRQMNRTLRAEKLVPIKKSVKLGPTVIRGTSVKASRDRKVGLSAESKERQRIQTACQPEFGNRGQFKSNERAVGMFENSKTENSSNTNVNGFTSADSLNNSVNQGSCGFSIQVPF